MPIHIVRLGSPRLRDEGVRLGTVRRPPRGVPKAEFASRDFYDVWLPELSPSAALVKQALTAETERDWSIFERQYRSEMKQPAAARWLDVLAVLSRHNAISMGCYGANEARCHRSVLRALLLERGAMVVERGASMS
jgi:uncharacterized protein YeaO (DUF488 family)